MEVFMTSIRVDIFDIPTTTWMDQVFDRLIICVDRGSGLIFALPTTKLQITGDKMAHILLIQVWVKLESHPSLHLIKVPNFSQNNKKTSIKCAPELCHSGFINWFGLYNTPRLQVQIANDVARPISNYTAERQSTSYREVVQGGFQKTFMSIK